MEGESGAMVRKLLCATLALGSSVGLLLAADAFTGRWRLDVTRSTFASDNPAPQELTLTFSEQGPNRIQILEGIAADGRATSTAWTAPMSGGSVTFPAGQGPNGGASVRVVDDNTLVMTANSPSGNTGASRTYQISADGKTLTLSQKRQDGREMAMMSFYRQ
jgi:hypothetical protein